MIVKFHKNLKEFKYILMFDLASHNTGVCLWNIKDARPVLTETIVTNKNVELPASELLDNLKAFCNKLVVKYGVNMLQDVLVVKEAMPTQLRGGSSTVQTFIALARSHCVLDTLMFGNMIPMYDYVGIYPITWHNLFKQENNLDKNDKITKELIHEYVIEHFHLDKDIGLDESDAVYLCHAFVSKKWNNDLSERIREIKRHRKTLKAAHAIKYCDEEIRRLESLKFLTNQE